MPAKLDRCVEDVKNDPNVDNAFAVCNSAIKSGNNMTLSPNVSIVDKKKKKKTDIHLLLNTPLEGKMNNIKINMMKLAIKRLADLPPQDEQMITRLMKHLENTEMKHRRDELTTHMNIRQDIAAQLVAEPGNDVIKRELALKDKDLTAEIQEILRTDKELRGGQPIGTEMLPLVSAKLLMTNKLYLYSSSNRQSNLMTAFEESKHPRDDSGEFTSKGGEG